MVGYGEKEIANMERAYWRIKKLEMRQLSPYSLKVDSVSESEQVSD